MVDRQSAIDTNPQLESDLVAAIEPWLAHMRWRKDFAGWRKRRIYQEDYQAELVADMRAALGGNLAGKKVLDLGSGMGGPAVALTRAGAVVYGLDLNEAYCKIARLRAKRYNIDLPVLVGVAERTPFPDGFFDGVLCMDVIEHVVEPELVLQEIARVLKPGGVCVSSAPNRFAFRDAHYHLPGINWLPRPLAERIISLTGHSKSGSQLKDRQQLSEVNPYTWSGLVAEARQAGLRTVDAVSWRLRRGEVRQLTGVRRTILTALRRTGALHPLYRLYRFGWQGTFQVRFIKPRNAA